MARSVINALSVAESTLIQHPPTAFLADESRFVEATAKMRRAREALQPLVDHLDAVLANAKA
jgi:hypothetical protein